MLFRTLVAIACLCLLSENLVSAQDKPGQFGAVELRGDSAVAPGTAFQVAVFLNDSANVVGGFNLLIEFDSGALVMDSAVLGQHTAGEWEYFTFRSGRLRPEEEVSTAAYLRMLAIADNQDPANKHPDSSSLVGPGEIARLYLYATDRKDYQGRKTELKFVWEKCADNTFSDRSGNRLMLAATVTGADGKRVTAEHYSGPPAGCFSSKYNPPTRSFNYLNHSIRID